MAGAVPPPTRPLVARDSIRMVEGEPFRRWRFAEPEWRASNSTSRNRLASSPGSPPGRTTREGTDPVEGRPRGGRIACFSGDAARLADFPGLLRGPYGRESPAPPRNSGDSVLDAAAMIRFPPDDGPRGRDSLGSTAWRGDHSPGLRQSVPPGAAQYPRPRIPTSPFPLRNSPPSHPIRRRHLRKGVGELHTADWRNHPGPRLFHDYPTVCGPTVQRPPCADTMSARLRGSPMGESTG